MRLQVAKLEDESVQQGAGERLRFESEVELLMPRLYRLCLALCRSRQEAEDLLQEALVRAFLHRNSFRGQGSYFGWLCKVVRSQFMEGRRNAARRGGLLESMLGGATAVMGWLVGGEERVDPEVAACQSQQGAMLLRCLHRLPEKFRMVVLLCDVEELGYEEVAGILGVPVGTVKSRHSRGRVQLGEAFRALQTGEAHAPRAGGLS
jgi:RNA polymerase sigma-70 factor, ECF subfamily